MDKLETIIASIGFLAIGIPAGYFAFLIFRISIRQEKFSWTGSLAVVTTLCGGSYLAYLDRPLHFGLYAIGFLLGFLWYLRKLTKNNSVSSRY
ncbi:hypothetical protein L4C42_16210 [Vibrio wakamikoensis]|uniref:hypothetical protein n=1 Tax=Vibrio wakamikoensis TaxID=2910251 RepID=UPI003D217358